MTIGYLGPPPSPPPHDEGSCGVDVSAAAPDSSGEGLSEGMRWRTEPCACGGSISCIDDWPFIAEAVRMHNATLVHQVWRHWGEE